MAGGGGGRRVGIIILIRSLGPTFEKWRNPNSDHEPRQNRFFYQNQGEFGRVFMGMSLFAMSTTAQHPSPLPLPNTIHCCSCHCSISSI